MEAAKSFSVSSFVSAAARLMGIGARRLSPAERRFALINGGFFCACVLMCGFALALVFGAQDARRLDIAKNDPRNDAARAQPAPAYKGLVLSAGMPEDLAPRTPGETHEH